MQQIKGKLRSLSIQKLLDYYGEIRDRNLLHKTTQGKLKELKHVNETS